MAKPIPDDPQRPRFSIDDVELGGQGGEEAPRVIKAASLEARPGLSRRDFIGNKGVGVAAALASGTAAPDAHGASESQRSSLYTAHCADVNAIAFNRDGTKIVTGSADNRARVWNASTFVLERDFSGHGGDVNAVAFNREGSAVASASSDGTVMVWSSSSGTRRLTYPGHRSPVTTVAYSAEGTRLLSGGADGAVHVWNATTGQLLRSYLHGSPITALAVSSGGRLVGSAAQASSSIHIWDIDTGVLIRTYDAHAADPVSPGTVSSIASLPNLGAGVATQGTAGAAVRFFGGVSVSGTNFVSAATTARGKSIVIRGRIEPATADLGKRADIVAAFKFVPRGVTAGEWYSIGSGAAIQSWNGDPAGLPALVSSATLTSNNFSFDIFAGSPSFDGKVTLYFGYRLATGGAVVYNGSLPIVLEGTTTHIIHALAFGGLDGLSVVSAGSSNVAHLWNASTGQTRLKLQGHTGTILSASYSADGSRIATGGADRFAKIWNSASGAQVATYVQHGYDVTSVAFSPQSPDTVASASRDNTVRLWQAANAASIGVLSAGTEGCSAQAGCTCDLNRVCSCDLVCTCDTVCTCDAVCSCVQNVCSCVGNVCSCNSQHYWYPN